MPILVLMGGIPGSGKSTLAKKLFANKRSQYISRDEVRFSIIKDNEPYFSKEKQVFNEYMRLINASLLDERLDYVIADATHLNYGSRMKLFNRLNARPEKTYLFFVNTPLEIALERNKQRTGRALVPEDSIINMYKAIETPRKDEPITTTFVFDENGIVYRKG